MTNILNKIGETQVVPLPRMFPQKIFFLKLEGQNPGGSSKDRVARFLVNRAIESGVLRPGMRILEATSGNMGIALAMVGVVRGIGVTIVMSEGTSRERQQMIRAFGAELILTSATGGTTVARAEARRIFAKNQDKFWFANQFDNPDNALAHERELAPEIWRQLPEVRTIVAGVGISGTVMGLARFFKKNAPYVQIVGVLPPPGFGVQGLQNPDGDFRPKIWDPENLKTVAVSKSASFSAARDVARTEGMLLGQSSGAVLAAIQKNNFLEPIVGISADRGEKYLSTGLFQYNFQ